MLAEMVDFEDEQNAVSTRLFKPVLKVCAAASAGVPPTGAGGQAQGRQG